MGRDLQARTGLKHTSADRRLWVLQLRYPGNAAQAKRTLGQYPGMTLAQARAPGGMRWSRLASTLL